MSAKSSSFIVRLADQSSFNPKLSVRVSVVKEKKSTYLLQIIHPNTKVAVHEEEIVDENPSQYDAVIAVTKKGQELLASDKLKAVETKYEPIIHIPAARKGRTKLKTKESVLKGTGDEYADESSDIALEDIEMDNMDAPMDDVEEIDVEIEETVVVIVKEKKASKVKPAKNNKKIKVKAKAEKKVKKVVKNNKTNKNKKVSKKK